LDVEQAAWGGDYRVGRERARDSVRICATRRLAGAGGTVGKASEGLLLLTNDSEWAARVLDPSGHVPKTYHVQIATVADAALLDGLRGGVRHRGELLPATRVNELRRGEKNSWLEIVLHEGRNRHIRRMLGALGIEVLRLVRVAVGGLELGALAKGEARKLTAAEKASVERWNEN
jgi:23S rRNA pseudouridine2605 synthase